MILQEDHPRKSSKLFLKILHPLANRLGQGNPWIGIRNQNRLIPAADDIIGETTVFCKITGPRRAENPVHRDGMGMGHPLDAREGEKVGVKEGFSGRLLGGRADPGLQKETVDFRIWQVVSLPKRGKNRAVTFGEQILVSCGKRGPTRLDPKSVLPRACGCVPLS